MDDNGRRFYVEVNGRRSVKSYSKREARSMGTMAKQHTESVFLVNEITHEKFGWWPELTEDRPMIKTAKEYVARLLGVAG